MSLVRKPSKNTLRLTTEDYSSCLDQKNGIIAVLQGEVEELRLNQERYDRVKDQLYRAKTKLQSLLKECEISKENNQERLQLSARNVYELKVQINHLENQLKVKAQALRETKFNSQQLVQLSNRKEDEITDIQIKWQEQKNLSEVRKMEEERTKLQIGQVKEEVDKQRKQNLNIKKLTDTTVQKCHKTQSYIRNLLREEANLNQNLTKVEDENNQLDTNIEELDSLINRKTTDISNIDKDCQEARFLIASKELQKKKYQNQIKEKIRILSAEKEKWKLQTDQWENKKAQVNRLDSYIAESSEEINFILAKNSEIVEVNTQLKDDLKVCVRHLENVSRINKCVETEILQMQQVNQTVIKKLQEPIVPRNLNIPSINTGKWGSSSSRVTDYQTGEIGWAKRD